MRVQSALLESMRRHQDKLVRALIARRGVPQHRKALRGASERYRDGWVVQFWVILVRQYVRSTLFVRIR